MNLSRDHALSIWRAAVAAADPFALVRDAVTGLHFTGRALVVGGGKAGAAMAAGVEASLGQRTTGIVNVPEGATRSLKNIELIAARPAGSNHPTAAGVAGVDRMLSLVQTAQPGDVGVCLLSGGGSALLPAPSGVTLEDKQYVTKLLHASGATIGEMNCVRKHLSRFKGGRLAEAFACRGCPLYTFILSDVVGDPLDVIASGPTAPDPTTCADALEVLRRYSILDAVPAVRVHLERGDETPKTSFPGVNNIILGNNARSLIAASQRASDLGYRVLNLGSFVEGEARHVAAVLAGIVRSIRRDGVPVTAPVCVLYQELTLAALLRLHGEPIVFLAAGTDGEDGPTDAAGAIFDANSPLYGAADALRRHDAYTYFDRIGGLVRTGLTGTNVMDVAVILIG
ncbi:MAG: DUF4147 domain-containing protein [Planctomycetia bacterium]|nr:DUF4147 domain-containing protein [Planctomycetia bacterium]